MEELFTLAAMGTAALSGLIGNRIDHLVCRQTKAVWHALRDGQSEPRNGDLARAIRRAQLMALRLGVKSYKDIPHPGWRESPGYSQEDITTPLLTWIDRALIVNEPSTSDGEAKRRVEERIERAFTHPAPHEGAAARRQEELRDIALEWTLEEAHAHAPGVVDWPRFVSLLRSGGPTSRGNFPGWWPLFRGFLAEEIKRDERVQRILAEQGIARLLELQIDLSIAVESLQTGFEKAFESLRGALDELREASSGIAGSTNRIEEAIRSLDRAIDRILPTLARIEDQIRNLPNIFQSIVDSSGRDWDGIQPLTGRIDPSMWPDRFRDRPTNLLLAPYQIVEFLDRGGMLAALLEWATDNSERRVQGRLYIAPGGSGKTRLGIELIDALAKRGWRCTFLSAEHSPIPTVGALQDLLRPTDTQGICVVVDYAESQSERFLRSLTDAAFAAASDGPPIRLLAFARSAAGWWDDFCGPTSSSLVFDPTPFEVVGTVLSEDERTMLFVGARRQFLKWLRDLGLPFRDEEARPNLTSADRPLSVIALAFLDACGVDLGDKSVFETLYQEERKHWRRVLEVSAHDAPEIDDLARAAAQITLVQGATKAGAKALIKVDGDTYERVIPGPKLVPPLVRLYGMTGPLNSADAAIFIKPIEPDLLGEHVAMRVLQQHRDDLIVTTMTTTLADPTLYPNGASKILTVLTRAARPEHDRIVQDGVEAAISCLTEAVPSLTAELVKRFSDSMPQTSIALGNLNVVLANRLVDLSSREQNDAALSVRSLLLRNLGTRLQQAGRDGAALTPTEEAVAICRELVGRNRDAFLRDLARSLYNLGARHICLGHDEAALAATEEAVVLYREIVGDKRDEILPELGLALVNHGNSLVQLEHHNAALAVTEESVTVHRELVGKDRDAFLPYLAVALINHSTSLSRLDRDGDALTASEEAVAIQRELVGKNRDAFLPELVIALNNLGDSLARAGRSNEALVSIEEAVRLSRTLVDKNRDAFLPELAVVLQSLGKQQSTGGDHAAACTATEEAVEIRRELVRTKGDGFLPDLAHTLNNHGGNLFAVGHHEAALTTAEESAVIYGELVQSNRDRFLPDLAMALKNIYRCLTALGRHDAAFSVTNEAAILYRELVGKRPDEFLPELGMSLANITNYLCDRGGGEAALAATEEGVAVSRKLIIKDRDRFLPGLASFLSNLGNQLSKLRRRDAALAAFEEAVTLFRELVGKSRADFLPDLAHSLKSLGDGLSALGRQEAALAAAEETVQLYQELATQSCDTSLADLSGALSSLGFKLDSVRRSEDALGATRKAVELWRELVARNRGSFLMNLAAELTNLTRDLFNLRRIDEALGAINEGVGYHRELLGKDRELHLPRLVEALNNAAIVRSNAGQSESGLEAAKEAVELGREAAINDPDGTIPELAKSLANFGKIMHGLGHTAEAKDAWAEGAKLMRPLAMRSPEAFEDLFVMLRNQWFRAVSELAGQWGAHEGSAAFDEADRLFRSLLSGISANGAAPSFEGRAAVGEAADDLIAFLLAEQSGNEAITPIAAAAELVAADLAAAAGGEDAGDSTAIDMANRADVFLNWRRACARRHPDDAKIRSELVREIYSAWDEANDRGERDRCSEIMSEIRNLMRTYKDDAAVREGLARMLFSSADDPDHGPEFLRELHELRNANLEDTIIRELDAWALHMESNNAGILGDEGHHDVRLNELRDLSARYPADAAVRVPLAKSLKINGEWAISREDVGRRDSYLNELRALASAHSDDRNVRLALVEVLCAASVRGLADGRVEEVLFQEVISIVYAHPDDKAVAEFFNSRFKAIEVQ